MTSLLMRGPFRTALPEPQLQSELCRVFLDDFVAKTD